MELLLHAMEALAVQRLPATPAIVSLLGVLAWAAASDLSARRIPNTLVLLGLALAWQGQWQALGGLAGSANCLAGAIVGGVLMLPGYWLRAMSAGDVKLMSMAGAFFGGVEALSAGLAAMLAGGVMALVPLLLRPSNSLANLRWLLFSLLHPRVGAAKRRESGHAASARMPYGVAIAIGSCAVLWCGR